jgi:hypothetical protein
MPEVRNLGRGKREEEDVGRGGVVHAPLVTGI